MIPIVDAHLDLAENLLFCGRDLTLTAYQIRERENKTDHQAMATLPDLQRGSVAVVFGTLFAGTPEKDASPERRKRPGVYPTAEQAEANAIEQIELYEEWQRQGHIRLIKSVAGLDHHLDLWQQDRLPGVVILMEGADPIVKVEDLPKWWQRGVRLIGPAWADTKYSAGVAAGSRDAKKDGLSTEGIALLEEMARIGFIWDISHMSETAVWQGLDLRHPAVCATHANARALMPTNRHLTDDVIRAIGDRGGVIGVTLYNGFLDPQWKEDKATPVSLDTARLHAEHIAGIAGWSAVGIGSDLDGGFGLEETPEELDTVADLHKLGSIAPEEHREAVLSANWLTFLRKSLPRG